MSLRRIVDATVEPLTLAEAKAHLRYVTADNDAYITEMITETRRTCEDRIQRTLLQTDWLLTLDAFPCAIPLRMPPVMSVVSVQYVDVNGATQLLGGTEYQVDTESEPGWIVPAFGKTWPTTREQINSVSVTYRCGYGVSANLVPGPIRRWIKLAMGTMDVNRESELIGRSLVTVPLGFCDHLLDTYRMYAL